MVFGVTRRSRTAKEVPLAEMLFLEVVPTFLLGHEENDHGETPEPLFNVRHGIAYVVLEVERLLSHQLGFPLARREVVEQDHYFRATLSYDGLKVEYELGLQPFFAPDMHETLQPVPEQFRRRHDFYYDGSFDIIAPVIPFPLAKDLVACALESHLVTYNPLNILSGPLRINYVSREDLAKAGGHRPEGIHGKPVFDKLGMLVPEDVALHQSDGEGYRRECLRDA
ncbi:MAG: hypothetical protein Q7R76_03050 [Candidatus Woesearchaeota archaeon]|nr:hypothetical protein [Candidatus Woesearchaeota archaeon]